MPELPIQTTAVCAETLESPKKKKRKLSDSAVELDQYDSTFGIQLEEGEVVLMSDESVVSSINSEERSQIQEKWTEIQVSALAFDCFAVV